MRCVPYPRPVKDAHGNVVGLADADGSIVVTYSYDAWGNEVSSTGAVMTGDNSRLLKDANPFRYSSYYFDETSGLYYLKARYYSPELGRFLSRDLAPGNLRDGLSRNPYLYAMNNVVNYIDESGFYLEGDIAPAFNEVQSNPFSSIPDSPPSQPPSPNPYKKPSRSRTASVLKGTAVAAGTAVVDAAGAEAAKKLPSQARALLYSGNMQIGTGWVNLTGNALLKKFALIGAGSIVMNIVTGYRNIRDYGWQEGWGRTSIDIAGTWLSAVAAGALAAPMAAIVMPGVATVAVTALAGLGASYAVSIATDYVKRKIYEH